MSRSRLALPVLALTGILASPAFGASSPIVPVAAPAPVKLAVFDFELEDTSAGISAIASDATELANATEAIRRLLTQSGAIKWSQPAATRTPRKREAFMIAAAATQPSR